MTVEGVKLVLQELTAMYPGAQPTDIWMNVDVFSLTSGANYFLKEGFASVVFFETAAVFRVEHLPNTVYDSVTEYIDITDINVIQIKAGRKKGVVTTFQV